MLTYDFRLPPGPRTVEYALLAENLGFRAVWCPEVPAFGHDIWVTLARIAEKTKRIRFGPAVLIPSYRHPMAQASAIATLEQIAPGRLMVGFGTGFTGRAGMGKKALSLESMRTHITRVKALLRGDVADIDGGLAQILASGGQLPDRPINVPIYMAGQGPKARALAGEITDGLIALGGPAEGFTTCLVSANGTVLDDGEDVTSPRASTAVRPIIALAYHHRWTTDPESVKGLPNGEAWLASVERVDENVRHLSVHRGHNLDVSNGHDALVDVSNAKQMTFTGTREELRERLAQFEARGATGVIFGTTGYDVERELRAYAEVAGSGILVIQARGAYRPPTWPPNPSGETLERQPYLWQGRSRCRSPITFSAGDIHSRPASFRSLTMPGSPVRPPYQGGKRSSLSGWSPTRACPRPGSGPIRQFRLTTSGATKRVVWTISDRESSPLS